MSLLNIVNFINEKNICDLYVYKDYKDYKNTFCSNCLTKNTYIFYNRCFNCILLNKQSLVNFIYNSHVYEIFMDVDYSECCRKRNMCDAHKLHLIAANKSKLCGELIYSSRISKCFNLIKKILINNNLPDEIINIITEYIMIGEIITYKYWNRF